MAIYRTQRIYSWLGKLFKSSPNYKNIKNLSNQEVLQELVKIRPEYKLTSEMKKYILGLADEIITPTQGSRTNLIVPYGLNEILEANRNFLSLKDSIIIASTMDMDHIYAAGNNNVGVAWKRNQDGSYYVEGTIKDFRNFI